MSQSLGEETLGDMINDAAQDIDTLIMPRNTENLIVENLERKLGEIVKIKVLVQSCL